MHRLINWVVMGAATTLAACSMNHPAPPIAPAPAAPRVEKVAPPPPRAGEIRDDDTPAVTEITTAYGEIPASLSGTWLVLTSVTMDGQRYSNGWYVYRISHTDSQWHVNLLNGKAPPALQNAVDAATKAGGKVEADATMIEAVASAVSGFEQPPPKERPRTIALRTPENFLANSNPPEGSKLSIEFLSKGKGLVMAGQMFWVTQMSPNRLIGETMWTQLAAAPGGVIPISLRGPYTMYRLQ